MTEQANDGWAANGGAGGRSRRVALLQQIESLRNSRVFTYICSDRPGAAANIGDDAVRPMYEHVRAFGKVPKLDLFLYSRGGAVEVPWRIISMLREHTTELSVLIPYRAHSAATLIALGCDAIVMGPKGELGPIDPALNRVTPQEGGGVVQEEIRVEDVMSYIGFIRDKAGLGDQAALAANVRVLAEKLSPWVLGNIYRTHSHIRMVARKMLLSHQARMDEARMNLLVEALAEKTYLHGHAIARAEAKDLGLPVESPYIQLESAMWSLLELYETRLAMREPIDAEQLIAEDTDEYVGPIDIALIESTARITAFRGDLRVKRVRQTPGEVKINLNLAIGLPPGIDPALVPQEVAQRLQQQLQAAIPKMVQDQARRQSPVLRVEARINSGYWRDVTSEAS
jgi:hypothetical protein